MSEQQYRHKQSIVWIVCSDRNLLHAYRAEFERRNRPYRLRPGLSPAEGRNLQNHDVEPGVIVLDESAAQTASQRSALEATAERLIEVAPVVVVAEDRRRPELRFLVASGAVDFVPRGGDFVLVAANRAEWRIRMADYATEEAESFAEILRHEVNNPLTGILGNAEMLLARRERLPSAAVERIETIAVLAIRLRETVRRLSHDYEGRQDPVRSA